MIDTLFVYSHIGHIFNKMSKKCELLWGLAVAKTMCWHSSYQCLTGAPSEWGADADTLQDQCETHSSKILGLKL